MLKVKYKIINIFSISILAVRCQSISLRLFKRLITYLRNKILMQYKPATSIVPFVRHVEWYHQGGGEDAEARDHVT